MVLRSALPAAPPLRPPFPYGFPCLASLPRAPMQMRSPTMWLGIAGGLLMAILLYMGIKGSLIIGIA